MTRGEFMQHAKQELEHAFSGQKNRIMNLVEQAWAEGKRNAELESIEEVGNHIAEIAKKTLTDVRIPLTISADAVNKAIAQESTPNSEESAGTPMKLLQTKDCVFYGCGACGQKLIIIDNGSGYYCFDTANYPRYCPKCGTKIKWED